MEQENFSYSKLSTYDQCPYKFKLRYEDKLFPTGSTFALEIGTIAHKCKELVALALIAGEKPDYEAIKNIFYNGYDSSEFETSEKDHGAEHLAGANELKAKYPFDFMAPDTKSGMTYDEKFAVFVSHLEDMEKDEIWRPKAVEVPFSYVFGGQYHIKGFIDKIEENAEGMLRVVDYKTSKALFLPADVKTSMQMLVYSLAVREMFDQLPHSHLYDFVFLGKTQDACTPGYLKRGETKLKKWFDGIEKSRVTGDYKPSPSPLCHWCDYCKTNDKADEALKWKCPYHSLWTPSNKTFATAKKYSPEDIKKEETFWF